MTPAILEKAAETRVVGDMIAGEPSVSGRRWSDVFVPSAGRVQARVALGGAGELARAVTAAEKAQPAWAALNPQRRARIMVRIKTLIEEDMDDAILGHPGIAAVSFVGSSDVAHYVYARAAAAGKRVQAMRGAKNHGVVTPDADLEPGAQADSFSLPTVS